MKKALKIVGIVVALLVLSVGSVFAYIFTPPSPEAVCENMMKVMEKEKGSMPDGVKKEAQTQCVKMTQPGWGGVNLPYTKYMRCLNSASSSAELDKCEQDRKASAQ